MVIIIKLLIILSHKTIKNHTLDCNRNLKTMDTEERSLIQYRYVLYVEVDRHLFIQFLFFEVFLFTFFKYL